ncbi:hypothetical protein [Opitutus sp. ER46]|uniref:hypothetical protein n=1 Tax=Opitutus sp. ER46 TaxID=2161864 RepID=UPI000D3240F4|nr:hypothetical protein [Opitutus sp. ER46]PTX96459.1 hypothetical protein DB354_07295 [Opitutus sp. ER46]
MPSATDLSPATPPKPATPFTLHHRVAAYAALAVPGSIALNLALSVIVTRTPAGAVHFILTTIPLLVMLSAIPAGIFALCGIPRYGTRGLLWRGLFGIILPIILVAIVIVSAAHRAH